MVDSGMTDPIPSNLPPHRTARIDQSAAQASSRLDKLIAAYREAAAEDGDTSALGAVALTLRLSGDHMDVAVVAAVAVQRLAALDAEERPGHPER